MKNSITEVNIKRCVLTSVTVFFMVIVLMPITIFAQETNAVTGENGSSSSNSSFNLNLENGSFEKGNQEWTGAYKILHKDNVPSWHTTATDGMIELFKENTGTYIPGVLLRPTDGMFAAELNANEESTLYQNVTTTPDTVYEWGLDHGARNGTDTMALVIGPKQDYDPSKPNKMGRDQLMQMVDWLIEQGKTSVKKNEEVGVREKLTVYSKKFAANGTFDDNGDDNAFSLSPSEVHTEQWKIWIIADNKKSSSNSWGHYGINDKNHNINDRYWQYTVPENQNVTLFGFVSVGFDEAAVKVDGKADEDKVKTYGNFLDNINFYHPLSISTTAHGRASVKIGDGETIQIGEAEKLVNQYVPEDKTLTLQAIVEKEKVDVGCEFAGVYCTSMDETGNPIVTFLSKTSGWTHSTNIVGDEIYTYSIEDVKTATDFHFVFIKSATITYDTNGGQTYEQNVYSFKPTISNGDTVYASPYVSKAAVGYDGWKFMGWKLNGDIVNSIPEGIIQHEQDKLGSLILPGVHTIACDYFNNAEAQQFKIYEGSVSLDNVLNSSGVQWNCNDELSLLYANLHKGLTLTAQWCWKQMFIPQVKNNSGTYDDSEVGGEIEVINPSGSNNYENGNKGAKAYFANVNETITVIATAKEGCIFDGWYDAANGGKLVCEKNKFSYIETKEGVNTYYARFSINKKEINEVTSNYTGGIDWGIEEGLSTGGENSEDSYSGKLDKCVEVAEDAPIKSATLDNSEGELLDASGIFTKTEKDVIINGTDAKVYLSIGNMKISEILESDRTKIEDVAIKELGKNVVVEYMDVSLFKQIGKETVEKVHEPGIDIEVTIHIPNNMLINKKGQVRKYRILKLFKDKVEIVKGTFNSKTNEYRFKTNKFSTYAIAYADEKTELEVKTLADKKTLTKKGETLQLNVKVTPKEADQKVIYTSSNKNVATVDGKGEVTAVGNGTTIITVKTADNSVKKNITVTVKITTKDDTKLTKQQLKDNGNTLISKATATWMKKNNLKLTWGKVKGAAGYEVYVRKCDDKSIWNEKVYEVKKGTTESVTLKKLKGKKFNTVVSYKYAVRAFKYVNSKKVYMGESLTYHLVGSKNKQNTNPKKVIAKKKSIAIKVNKSIKISVKVIKAKPKCKILKHTPLIRYVSTNTKVAKVDKISGKVTGVKKGKCKIYCVAVNGVKATVDVTVK